MVTSQLWNPAVCLRELHVLSKKAKFDRLAAAQPAALAVPLPPQE